MCLIQKGFDILANEKKIISTTENDSSIPTFVNEKPGRMEQKWWNFFLASAIPLV